MSVRAVRVPGSKWERQGGGGQNMGKSVRAAGAMVEVPGRGGGAMGREKSRGCGNDRWQVGVSGRWE